MRKDRQSREKQNKGYTLVELIIVVAIFSVLLGILVPSLNALVGYRVRRATSDIGTALDRTREEAMNRLVAEMKLEWIDGDGYYISYILTRGREGTGAKLTEEDKTKIAPSKTRISYLGSDGNTYELGKDGTEHTLILTYDRATGAFREVQSRTMEIRKWDIHSNLEQGKDIDFSKTSAGIYCNSITISGGGQTRVITLNKDSGTYTVSGK